MVLMVALILAGFQLHELRQAKSEGWERAAGRADLAAEWVDSVFSLSDTALDGLDELNRSPLLALSTGSVGPIYEYLEFILGERRRRFTFLDELGLFDAQGRVVVTSTPAFPRGYNLGGLPHFRVFFQDSSLDEWVSGLYWTAFANDYRVMHVRRLDAGAALQSRFAVVRLTPQVFDQALDRLTMTRGENLAVFDIDSRLVARRPGCQDTVNCLTVGEIDDRPEIESIIAGGQSRHRIRLTSPVDGVERLYSFTRVNGRPFVVASGESLDILLEGWWQRLWIRVGILLLVVLLGAAALRHYLTRLRLEQSARIVATVFEGHQGMLLTDHKRRIVRANQAFSHITGYSEEEVIGRDLSLLASGQKDETFYQAICQSIAKEGGWEGEIWGRRRSGEIYPERLAISAVRDKSARITHYIATFSDISQQKAIEEEALQLAFFDPLTGLSNRRRLLGKLDELAEGTRRGDHFAALLIIGLDHFKRVNDLLGHQECDQL
ncbi:PAS domain-containing protein, partial [Halomonas sp.]|uniref:PAS domain-containing protein n=1 Tax=Halomonas sp. TaxID=1486246 RepID=UPI0025BE3059